MTPAVSSADQRPAGASPPPATDPKAFDAQVTAAKAAPQPQQSAPEQHWYDRPLGVLQAIGGVAEMAAGGALLATPEPTMLTKVAGVGIGVHGADDIQAGLRTAWTGHPTETVTQQVATNVAKTAGASPMQAAVIGATVDGVAGFAAPEGRAGAVAHTAEALNEGDRVVRAGTETSTVAREAGHTEEAAQTTREAGQTTETTTETTAEAGRTAQADATSGALRTGQTLSEGHPPVELDHVFEGEVSPKRGQDAAKGFHHAPADDLHPNARVVQELSPRNAHGVYEARVEVTKPGTGATYTKRSTMFPDSMSRDDVVKSLQNAYDHATQRSGNSFTGPSGHGFDVTGFTSGAGQDLHIRTGYPVYTP